MLYDTFVCNSFVEPEMGKIYAIICVMSPFTGSGSIATFTKFILCT